MLHRRICVFAWCVLLSGVVSAQADQLFEQGVEAFRRGDNAGAISAFKEALASNPGHEDAFAMLDQVEERVLLEMLVERGELGQLAERFLNLAELGRREVVSDPGQASEVVDRLLNGDEVDRQRALLELRATFGAWAVPALVGPLGDSSSLDNRVMAIQALNHLGSDAVLPLIQVLRSDDILTRRNAAAVLGSLGDPRGAAGLAHMAAHDDDDVARQVAANALGRLGLGGIDASGAAIDLAARYFRGDPAVVRPYEATSVLWRWQDGELEGRQVLGGLFALELAEDFALIGLGGGGSDEARALLSAIHAAQKAEVLAAQQIEELSDNELLEAAAERLGDLDLDLGLAGSHRGRGLMFCLGADPRREAAAAVLMQHMGGSNEELSALRTALSDPDPSVSQGAAVALARLGEADIGVVEQLGTALAGVPQRLVVSIGETGLFGGGGGWYLLSSSGVQAGLQRAKAFPPKDAIVIQDGLQGVTLDAMVFALKEDPRTADVPLIVVTNDVAGVQNLYGDTVERVLSSASFADVAEVAGERNLQQRAAIERAKLAAHQLASLDAGLARQAGRHVNEALQSAADDGVVAAVLGLVARTGMLEAQPSVDALVANDAAPSEVRVAAMQAAARLWAVSGGPSSGDLSGALMAALDSGDDDLAHAAAQALGQLRGLPAGAIRDAVR